MGNGKFAMQNLNDRLAIYLNEVLALEKANCEMELKIHQFMESRVGPSSRDYTAYYPTIADLKAKILDAKRINAEVHLSAENAALASDDFKAKYENELNMRVAVEADIGGLRKYLDTISLNTRQLEEEFEALNRELISLTMNHQEELKKSRPDMTEPDCICPKPAPSDLLNTMGEIRDHYEAIVAKNLRDLEIWYNAKIEGINNQVSTDKFSLENYRWEVNETKRTLQTIEIELKSMLDLKAAEEGTLIEIKYHHHQKLSAHQYQVSSLEHQICHLRADMECQMREYHILLDIKDRLEMEIAEYRRLIDGKNVGGISCVANPSLSSSSSTTSRKRVVTVVEKLVDGRVVSSSTETTSDPLTSS
ncbi:keratin, type I cytoskeletal 50 kDa-like [Stigmatopora argus]